ncbi:MAG TPA: hypothetical protein VKB51_18885 [bacterium]|nr:hypothetical protein [bacterium]
MPATRAGHFSSASATASMFDLGPIEIVIILVLGWLAFRHIIARRWPGIYRAFNFAFAFAVGMMLLFGLLARIHH